MYKYTITLLLFKSVPEFSIKIHFVVTLFFTRPDIVIGYKRIKSKFPPFNKFFSGRVFVFFKE